MVRACDICRAEYVAKRRNSATALTAAASEPRESGIALVPVGNANATLRLRRHHRLSRPSGRS